MTSCGLAVPLKGALKKGTSEAVTQQETTNTEQLEQRYCGSHTRRMPARYKLVHIYCDSIFAVVVAVVLAAVAAVPVGGVSCRCLLLLWLFTALLTAVVCCCLSVSCWSLYGSCLLLIVCLRWLCSFALYPFSRVLGFIVWLVIVR